MFSYLDTAKVDKLVAAAEPKKPKEGEDVSKPLFRFVDISLSWLFITMCVDDDDRLKATRSKRQIRRLAWATRWQSRMALNTAVNRYAPAHIVDTTYSHMR